jgi:hypothetical protein
MKKYILPILIQSLFFINMQGQNIQMPGTILTPNAYSLGKYGDIEMSYYTGKANVNIPLTSLNDQNIPLDVSLNYDTGGVRVGELPSWIGQNWTMNAGGVIVRTEKGKGCDETYFEPNWPNANFSASGYWYHWPELNTPLWTDPNYLRTLSPSLQHDYAPDIFTFNFMGYTGKFFLGSDGTWKVQSESNIKVEIIITDKVLTLGRTTQCVGCHSNGTPPKAIGKITLTDDKGNKYVFGNNNANAIEYSNANFFNYWNTMTKATAWYLTNVYDRFGNPVYTFNYERSEIPGENDFQANFYLNQTHSAINQGATSVCSYTILSPMIEGSLIMPVYLKSISSINGYSIAFNRSPSAYKYYTATDTDGLMAARFGKWSQSYNCINDNNGATLGLLSDFYLLTHNANDTQVDFGAGIPVCQPQDFLLGRLKYYKLDNVVITLNNTLLKTITLNRNSNLSERLNLTGVTTVEASPGGNNGTPSSYTFTYNSFGSLPYYLSKAIDHWGYFRGTNFSTADYANHYLTRTPNITSLQIGSLKRITYPTKGYTEFVFEPHSYSRYVNASPLGFSLIAENDIAGGLRVKTITTSDGSSVRVKNIKYTDAINSGVSSGILALKNRYLVTDYTTRSANGTYYTETNFSINNLLPMANFSGSHIAYSKVYEIETGNGFTEYQYTDFNDYPDALFSATLNAGISIFEERNSSDFKRGRIKQKSFYSESNQTQSLKTEIYNYSSTGAYFARGFSYKFFNPCPTGNGVQIGNAYQVQYSDFSLDSVVESQLFGGTTVSKTYAKNYTRYPNDAAFYGDTFLTSETESTYTGETKGKTYNYPFTAPGSVESDMLTKHVLPVTETISFGTSGSSSVLLKSKNIYTMQTINGASHPVITTVQSGKATELYHNDLYIDKYDDKGNVLQFHKENGINTSFRYSSTNLLLFKAEGAAWDETLNISNFNAFNANPDKKATGYTYNIFRNLLQITQPTGIIEKYTYDYNNRLEKILDGNDKVIKKFEYNIK